MVPSRKKSARFVVFEQTTLKFGAACRSGVRRAWASTRRGVGLAYSVPVLPCHAYRRQRALLRFAPCAVTSARRHLRSDIAPVRGLVSRFGFCSRLCALATALRSLRVSNAAARRPSVAGRALEKARESMLRGLLGLVSAHLDSFRSPSRPFCRYSRRDLGPFPLTAITWNHHEPPSSHIVPQLLPKTRNFLVRDVRDYLLPQSGKFSSSWINFC